MNDLYMFTHYFLDNDECTDQTDACDDNAACTNTDGSYTCACNAGFTDDSSATDGTSCAGECLTK